MNIYIMVDIEGISGIYSPEQVLPDKRRFQEGRLYTTEDVNVCVDACKEAGADKIFVRDCHGRSYTLIWEKLSGNADYYICGNSPERFPKADECDGVILLGYHAMAGTLGGTLEHTMSSASIQNYFVNGKAIGEFALDAGLLGEMGKPVIMTSGDDKLCNEAHEFSPDTVTAQVKCGMSAFGAMLLPREKAHKILHDKTVQAVKNLKNIKPLVFKGPIEFTVELTERTGLPKICKDPDIKIINGRTYSFMAKTLTEAFLKI